jgi:arylsulfatase
LTVTLPRGSALVFESVAPEPLRKDETLAPTTFRVRLDGATVFEQRQESARGARAVARRVELDARGGHELAFEIDGPGPALFARPALVPRELGASGARPWPEARPDLVLLLCDTFRADNLAAYGGSPELAPALNAFVERALTFRDARATAAWTLPAIGSLMSGVFPGMHGGTDLDRPVSEAVETLAEVLGRAGYRTAAVTDSGFFSRTFQQDQGFQWFEEVAAGDWNLAHTLARARAVLAADDGRPLFLVVHTYRVHGPMRLGPEEDPRPWSQFLASQKERVDERKAQGEHVREIALDLVDEGRRYYLDSVRDLDRKVGAWLAELESAGLYEHGVVLLTADHGNAYGEHDDVGHGGKLWDVKLAVPLALRGAGLVAREERGVVSSIDIAPTLAELARVAPSPSWLGRSLLNGAPKRPVFAFKLDKHHELALFADGRKVLAPDVAALAAGKPAQAFDLGADPGELANLAGTADWPRELALGLAGALEPLLVPIAGGDALELSPELKRQLQAIGYGSGAGR